MLTKDSLEPGVIETLRDVDINNLDPDHTTAVATLSAAVSFKRIADFFTTAGVAPAGQNTFWEVLLNLKEGNG